MDALPDREVQSKISGRNGTQISTTARPFGRAPFGTPFLVAPETRSTKLCAWQQVLGLSTPPRIHVFCRHVETRRKCPLTAGFSNASFESLVLRTGRRPISGRSLCGKKSRSWRRKGVVARSFAYELSLLDARCV